MNTSMTTTTVRRWLLALLLAGALCTALYGWGQSNSGQSGQPIIPAVAGPVDSGGSGG